MPTIKKLDRTALQNLRAPLEADLKAIGAKYGLDLSLGNGSFGDGAEASFKLILKVDDPEVKAAAKRAEWDRNCRYVGVDYNDMDNTGLRPEDFGTEFEYGGSTYRTTGIATKGRNSQKFPILVEVVKAGPRGGAVGETRMLPDTAVKLIRAATDAAPKKAAA